MILAMSVSFFPVSYTTKWPPSTHQPKQNHKTNRTSPQEGLEVFSSSLLQAIRFWRVKGQTGGMKQHLEGMMPFLTLKL